MLDKNFLKNVKLEPTSAKITQPTIQRSQQCWMTLNQHVDLF